MPELDTALSQVHNVPLTKWVLAAALANERVKRRGCGAAQTTNHKSKRSA
jgi:hypothetical protein